MGPRVVVLFLSAVVLTSGCFPTLDTTPEQVEAEMSSALKPGDNAEAIEGYLHEHGLEFSYDKFSNRYQAIIRHPESNFHAITIHILLSQARERQIKTLHAAIDKVRGFLQGHRDKVGPSGRLKKSNITDNDSAKMPSSKGVIQGYDGLAMVDAKHQIIVHAEAFGEGQEHGLFIPMLEGTGEHFVAINPTAEVFKEATVLADAGFCSETNAQYLAEHDIEGYIADTMFRKRDPRFKDAQHHKPTGECEPHAKPRKELRFQPKDFQLAQDQSHCICPAGKRLYRSGRALNLRGFEALKFKGTHGGCGPCVLRTQCLRHPDRTPIRQVAFFIGRAKGKPESYCARMKRSIDSAAGRHAYSRRLGIVEPVFGNIRHTKRLNRFTLRGRRKVNAQWQLYCLVHNIEKIQRYRRIDQPKKAK